MEDLISKDKTSDKADLILFFVSNLLTSALTEKSILISFLKKFAEPSGALLSYIINLLSV